MLVLALFSALGACSTAPEAAPPSADRASFEAQVLPVLIADCAFHACHGSSDRFFQVFGPGHGRLDPASRPIDPLSPRETEHAYLRALSMIDGENLDASPLLRKPLAIAAGGASHEGFDSLGRNVYQTQSDPQYMVLRAWVLAKAPAAAP